MFRPKRQTARSGCHFTGRPSFGTFRATPVFASWSIWSPSQKSTSTCIHIYIYISCYVITIFYNKISYIILCFMFFIFFFSTKRTCRVTVAHPLDLGKLGGPVGRAGAFEHEERPGIRRGLPRKPMGFEALRCR